MANKKITVVGDGAEEPLTPEEEHRLEVRVDQMLDPTLPDSQPVTPVAKIEPQPESTKKVEVPELAVTSTPKVTKIVTKFADDEPEESKKEESELIKPVPEIRSKAVPEAPAMPEKKPKPVSKKITVKHHEEELEKPKKSAAKHIKTKATKKLKVTIADGSESEDLDSKADAIAAAALAAEAQLVAAKNPIEEAEPEPVEELAPVTAGAELPEDLPETTDDLAGGAPPLIQKHSRAPIGVPEGSVPEAESEPEISEPPISKKISVLHDEDDEETVSEPATTEPPKVTEILIEEPEELAETIDVEVEPESESIVSQAPEEEPKPASQPISADAKKYRPPEGPIQFKRAEVPLQPHKPGEPRATEEPAAELSEDAAIAKAFETKAGGSSEKISKLVASLVRVLKWTIVGVFVLGIVAVAALPSLRHKALSLVGIDTAAHVSDSQSTSAQKQSTTPEAVAQDVYLAKHSGVYNLYRNSSDGQHEQLVLAGTGNETNSVALAPNALNTIAALVSTRDNKKVAGELQQSLSLVNISDGIVNMVDTADQIKIVDWFGDRIVYVLFNTSTSTTDTNRYQLVSYKPSTKTRTVLDHTNYLNDVLSARGSIYYATATSPASSGQFVTIKPDGSAKQVILAAEIASITRVNYDQMILSGINKWYTYKLGDKQATATNNISQNTSRQYVDSPDGKKSAYVTSTGTIMLLDAASSQVATLPATNATYPIHWLNNQTLVYRNGEADYLLKTDGSQPQKITDVSDVAGISLWHEQ